MQLTASKSDVYGWSVCRPNVSGVACTAGSRQLIFWLVRCRVVMPKLTLSEIGRMWMAGEPITGVTFALNDTVRVRTGGNAGQLGAVISVLSLHPEPKYLIELASGDVELDQSNLRSSCRTPNTSYAECPLESICEPLTLFLLDDYASHLTNTAVDIRSWCPWTHFRWMDFIRALLYGERRSMVERPLFFRHDLHRIIPPRFARRAVRLGHSGAYSRGIVARFCWPFPLFMSVLVVPQSPEQLLEALFELFPQYRAAYEGPIHVDTPTLHSVLPAFTPFFFAAETSVILREAVAFVWRIHQRGSCCVWSTGERIRDLFAGASPPDSALKILRPHLSELARARTHP